MKFVSLLLPCLIGASALVTGILSDDNTAWQQIGSWPSKSPDSVVSIYTDEFAYYSNIDFDNPPGIPCIIRINEKTALEIANAIMGDAFKNAGETATEIYDFSKDYYIVYRYIVGADGGALTVVISKTDGRILAFWGEE